MTDPVVVLVATPRGWAAALHAHAADHGGVVVRATVLSAADARTERCDVLLVDDVTSFLTPALVAAVHEEGRLVLGVFDPDAPQGRSDLVEAGVDGLVSAEAGPEEIIGTIRGLVAAGRPTPAPTPRRRSAVRDLPPVVGVTGPAGVGTTEVAIELAALLAETGTPTVLVDADETAPALAQRLNLALQPGILGAVDAHRRGLDLAVGLHRLTRRYHLSALPGMTLGQDWMTVPAGALADLITALARMGCAVVVDLGCCPAPLDGGLGLRFGHALSVGLTCSDLVVTATPTPVSIARALAVCSRARDGGARLHVVLNRVGRDRFGRDEAVHELRRALGTQTVHVLAEDPRVARAAWQGERVGRGHFATGMRAVAMAVATAVTPGTVPSSARPPAARSSTVVTA